MLLIAADTSGKYGSIALAQAGPGDSCEVLEVLPLAGGTFSGQLVPQLAALLAKYGFGRSDIGAFTVAAGPGSFTGLRVGLAAIKALAEVLGKPIAAVSLLEAVAVSGGGKGRLLAAFDAGRNETYAGEYEVNSKVRMLSEKLLTRQEFLAAANGTVVVTPDPGVAELARTVALQVQVIGHPTSDAVARLGWKKIQAGETILPENLEANYIRRSDAEILCKPVA